MSEDKPLFSILEDAVTYQGHSEICGCSDRITPHADEWPVTVTILERDARRIMGLLNEDIQRKKFPDENSVERVANAIRGQASSKFDGQARAAIKAGNDLSGHHPWSSDTWRCPTCGKPSTMMPPVPTSRYGHHVAK